MRMRMDGDLVEAPVVEPQFNLEYLLAGVTEQNLHPEVDTGLAAGLEVW